VKTLVLLIFVAVCIALTVIVLMQEGKDAGLGSVGGLGETYWGKNKSRSMEGTIVRATKYLAIAFLALAILLNMMPDKTKSTTASTVSESATEAEEALTETAEAASELVSEAAEAATEAAGAAEEAVSEAVSEAVEAATEA